MKKSFKRIMFFIIMFFIAENIVNAYNVDSISYDSSTKKLSATINGGALIQSIQGSCKKGNTTKYLGYVYFSGNSREETASWDFSGIPAGTYECYFYTDFVADLAYKSPTVYVYKSTFKSCDDVNNNLNGGYGQSYCNRTPDDGSKCEWAGSKCIVATKKEPSDTKEPQSDTKEPVKVTTCSGSKKYYYNGKCNLCPQDQIEDNGACYAVNKFNCLYFGYNWTNNTCDRSKSCGRGNYYNNDSSIAAVGCYKMEKSNCATFGFAYENGECNYNKLAEKSDNTVVTETDYSVTIDSNYGNAADGTGLVCDSPLSQTNDSPVVCSGTISGDTGSFPSNADKMQLNGNYLLGWTKTVVDGKLVCSTPLDTIIKGNTYQLSADTAYYACYEDNISGVRYALDNASADGQTVKCGDALEISYCYKDSNGNLYCQYTKNGDTSVTGIVNRYNISNEPTLDTEACNKTVNEEENCTTSVQKNKKGKFSFNMCVDKNDYKDIDDDDLIEDVNDKIKCKSGYELDENYTSIDGNLDKGYVTVYAKCVIEDEEKTGSSSIELGVTSGNVNGTTGVIKVNARSKAGNIEKYYVSETYKTPTGRSSGWEDTNSDSFTITTTPGIVYIWVMDSEGNISNGIGGAVFDTVNTDTTVSKLELYDANGNVQSPSSNTAYKVNGITSSNYVKLSNSLNNDSVVADNGFNPFDMEYKLEVSSPTISVYATLTSTDASYVSGYEPRTVNLDYGVNTILIKIQNKEGKVRTYTILVTRVDDRTADNTLKDLSVDVGTIEFNSNKAEYKVEIPKDTKKVNVNASIAKNKASFVEGYEPGEVEITSDATVKLIKVKSETGSTRTYVITFVKEGTDLISDESLQLGSLSIPGVRLAFEKDISNYSLSVGYTTDVIDLNTVLNNKDSKVVFKLKRLSDSDYNIVSGKGLPLDVGENFVEIIVVREDGSNAIYRLTIIRKEFGLELSNDTTLSELKVLGYDIDFEPSKKEYIVRIKQEKTLVITAIPNSTRSEVFIRGNDELTGFSTVRIKVVAENGEYETYSVDIKKDAFNKTIEIAAIVAGVVIIIASSCIIVIKNKNRSRKEYFEE